MRGKNGRWLYTAQCEKRAKWPSERRTPVYNPKGHRLPSCMHCILWVFNIWNVCSNESSSWNIPCKIKFYMTVSFFHSFNAWQAISGTSKWLKPSILRHSYSVLVPVFGKPAHIIFIVISHNQNWMFYNGPRCAPNGPLRTVRTWWSPLCKLERIYYRRLKISVIEIGNTVFQIQHTILWCFTFHIISFFTVMYQTKKRFLSLKPWYNHLNAKFHQLRWQSKFLDCFPEKSYPNYTA